MAGGGQREGGGGAVRAWPAGDRGRREAGQQGGRAEGGYIMYGDLHCGHFSEIAASL